ncbi:MAG: BTAD domain-containing putative transcriptional regulator, partial [Gemmatimonadota bacterium]|nr:BTAD domain-containing putative transcriptional regulator [Gemmatimonadota bacterium]
MIEIRALGPLELLGPDERADPAAILTRPKRAAVLAYLACSRPYGARLRDELLGMFWPRLSQEKAGRALNQSVYVLRSALGEGAIWTRGEHIGLEPDRVWIDVVAFDAALESDDARRALELHRGDFLQGFYLGAARSFERWLDTEREHYLRRVVDAAGGLATAEQAAGNPVEAIRWLRYALEIRPYEERLLRRLLRLLVEQGDRASAARDLDRFAGRLRDELGVDASPETYDVVRIRTRAPAVEPRTGDHVTGDRSDAGRRPSPGAVPPPSSVEPPAPSGAKPRSRRPSSLGARRLALMALLGVGLLTAAAARAWFARSSDALSDRTRVLVAPLENRTNDPALNGLGRIAADWISRGLLATGLLEVVPATVPRREGETWTDLGDAAGAGLIVTGSLQRNGPEVVLTSLVLDVEDG